MPNYPQMKIPTDDELLNLLRNPQIDTGLAPAKVESLPEDEYALNELRCVYQMAAKDWGKSLPAEGRGKPREAWQEVAAFGFMYVWKEMTNKIDGVWERGERATDVALFVQAALYTGGLGVVPLSTIRDWADRTTHHDPDKDIYCGDE